MDIKKQIWLVENGCLQEADADSMIRKTMVLPQIKKAQITIAGLGIFEVFINGKK